MQPAGPLSVERESTLCYSHWRNWICNSRPPLSELTGPHTQVALAVKR